MEKEIMDNEAIIEEEFEDTFEATIEEETSENGEKKMCFRSILSEANTLNGNRRVYPKDVLRAVYTEAKERAEKTGKPIFGELEHAKDSHVNLERIAVTFPEFVWNEEKGQIVGKAVPTLTDAGETVRKLALSGFPIMFSSRMTGKVKPLTEARKKELGIITEDKAVEVLPGARLISIDIVGDPSCKKAVSETVYEEQEPITEEKKYPTFKQIFDATL